ncbi:MAG: M42 family peptidase [Oscillospiraceae bacterium]|nr:M42 family peptidase [Oscillospiraceae bacterium]
MNLSELKTLCSLYGTSGREHDVRNYILQALQEMQLPEDAVKIDRLGNVLVHKKGAKPAEKRVLFSAHMDEVALMVTQIHGDGTLGFDMVGGVNAAAVIGRQVAVGKNHIPGVIGCKPIHLMSKSERSKPAEMHSLYCDIGTLSKEETEQQVHPGDVIYFCENAEEIGKDTLLSKAIDDRFGCEILLTLLRQDLPYDTDFAFVVQEEVGLRGAAVAARSISPEFAIVLEATTAADIPGSEGADRVCSLGGGAVISFMDGRTIYDKALYDLAVSVCEQQQIPWQTKTKIAGGNDAGAIQNAGDGVRVLAVSVPCRYLHAPCSLIRLSDAEACEKIACALIPAIQEAAL